MGTAIHTHLMRSTKALQRLHLSEDNRPGSGELPAKGRSDLPFRDVTDELQKPTRILVFIPFQVYDKRDVTVKRDLALTKEQV